MRIGTIGILALVVAVGALCAGCSTPAPGQPTPAAAVTVTSAATGTNGTMSVAFTLTARNIAFDKTTLSAPAGSTVVMSFVNDDAGVPHNFALYSDATATTTIFKGAVINGPATTIYTFTAPGTPGAYFFRCDPHPQTMTGSFIVT